MSSLTCHFSADSSFCSGLSVCLYLQHDAVKLAVGLLSSDGEAVELCHQAFHSRVSWQHFRAVSSTRLVVSSTHSVLENQTSFHEYFSNIVLSKVIESYASNFH